MTEANIRSSVRELVFGDSTDTSYSDTDLDRNVEQGQLMALGWALETKSSWQINGERAYILLEAGINAYNYPDDLISLNTVRIKLEDEYQLAEKIDSTLVDDIDNYYPPRPQYDSIDDKLLIFLPYTLGSDVSEGIEIEYQTNDAITLPEVFTRVSIFYATYIYALAKELYSKASKFESLLGLDQPVVDSGLKKEVKTYYSNRNTTKKSFHTRVENNE